MSDILVYDGPGVSGFHRGLAERSISAEAPQCRVRKIDAPQILSEGWDEKASVLVMPGGRDLPYLSSLRGEPNRRIREFVHNGGAYLGFCAGAYYASHFVDFERGTPLEVLGKRELNFFPGSACGPVFNRGSYRYGHPEDAVAARLQIADGSGSLAAYYSGGCYFENAEEFPGVSILLRYEEPDEAAVISCNVGRGKAILSGVHLEYAATDLVQRSDENSTTVSALLPHEETRRALLRSLLRECGLAV